MLNVENIPLKYILLVVFNINYYRRFSNLAYNKHPHKPYVRLLNKDHS